MQELLSTPSNRKGSVDDGESYELNLLDCADLLGFDVQVIRHSFGTGGVGHEIEEVSYDHFTNLDEAKQHYAARKQALANRGFTESDMDM
jgi:hypothetical protein